VAAPADPGQQGTPRQLAEDRRLERAGYRFDAAAADRVCEFVRRFCRHSKGRQWAGQPLVMSDWQVAIVRRFFGWRRPNGTRRYRRLHVWVPRKNGKSTWAAAIALYLLVGDGEHGAEIYSLASDKDQARQVFGEAKNMVDQSGQLSEWCTLYKDSIFFQLALSRYAVLSAKPTGKHGLNPHAVIIDELHAITDRELYDVATTGSVARLQPVELVISTAGFDRKSIAYEQWDYAVKVRDGIIEDPEFLGCIFAADPQDDWRDEATWYKANPNLGVSVQLDEFRAEFKKACQSPGRENAFKRLHLNMWTEQAVRWLQIETWDRCAGQVEAEALAGRPCYGGLDLSQKLDLTAFVLVFPLEDLAAGGDADGRPRLSTTYDVVPHFWIPKEGIERRARRDRVPYARWAEQGLITVTDGDMIDYNAIFRDVTAAHARTPILELAYDRTFAYELVPRLMDEGITMVPFGQGFLSMSEPTKMLEALVVSNRIRHGGHPVLRWNASNVAVRQDPAGNLKPDKDKSVDRIDGVVATIMALGRALLREKAASVYEKRGILRL